MANVYVTGVGPVFPELSDAVRATRVTTAAKVRYVEKIRDSEDVLNDWLKAKGVRLTDYQKALVLSRDIILRGGKRTGRTFALITKAMALAELNNEKVAFTGALLPPEHENIRAVWTPADVRENEYLIVDDAERFSVLAFVGVHINRNFTIAGYASDSLREAMLIAPKYTEIHWDSNMRMVLEEMLQEPNEPEYRCINT